MRRIAAVLVAAACACHGPSSPRYPDAPLELRDASDRAQAIDRMYALAPGPARAAARAPIAAAIAHELTDALDSDHPFAAAALLGALAELWTEDATHAGAELAAIPDAVAAIRRARAVFAKAGTLPPAITAIVLLAEADAPNRAAHIADLDAALAFADDLAIAESGAQATRSQPIEILGPTVLALPLPWLVDRYVALVADRQHAVSAYIDQHGATVEVVRAHHDILSSARRIAIALARGGRPQEIRAHLESLTGIGADPVIASAALLVAEQPTAETYAKLATALRTDEHAPDDGAALAVCLAGLAKFPPDRDLTELAADIAAALGRTDQPIALYEAAIALQPKDVEPVLALRLGKLYAQRIVQLGASGRPAAADAAWHALEHEATTSHGDASIWAQVAADGEAALGKGLLAQGRIRDAESALTAAAARAPSTDAFETLATLDYQLDRLPAARRWAAEGIATLGETTADHYRRARLQRLAADIQRRGNDPKGAADLYLDSLRSWASLGDARELPRAIAAERLLDSGRATWFLGDADKSVELVLGAVDTDDDDATIATGAVAFLIEIDHDADALDAYHRALASAEIGEDDKIYMSLWVVAEARRRGVAPDRIALDYLTARRGPLWYEQLAEAATGRRAWAAVGAAASTAAEHAELAYYGATLGLDPRAATPAGERALLARMVDSHLVLDTEYDLARAYLAARHP